MPGIFYLSPTTKNQTSMKTLLFAFLFISIVLVILFYDRIRMMKIFQNEKEKAAERAARKAAKEEEYFRRTSQKYYRREEKTAEFEKDYFKSTDSETAKPKEETQKSTVRRKTTNSDGVTIIDERQTTEKPAKEKKIFDDNEGEYVEFEEV